MAEIHFIILSHICDDKRKSKNRKPGICRASELSHTVTVDVQLFIYSSSLFYSPTLRFVAHSAWSSLTLWKQERMEETAGVEAAVTLIYKEKRKLQLSYWFSNENNGVYLFKCQVFNLLTVCATVLWWSFHLFVGQSSTAWAPLA